MPSSYFPFGVTSGLIKASVSYSFNAITASVARPNTITVPSASYAVTSASRPPAGVSGTSITFAECQVIVTASNFTPLIPYSGSKGLQGPTGSQGTAYAAPCPAGTIRCAGLEVSLSMALPGYPSGINASRPSGSRFSIICMQVPAGCTTAICPTYLYTASLPTIP